MSEAKRNRLDTALAPEDRQVQAVGQSLLSVIRQSIAIDRISHFDGDDPFGLVALLRSRDDSANNDQDWWFSVQGNTAMIDQEGYVREPLLRVAREEWNDTDNTRNFLLSSVRSTPEDKKADIFRVIFRKNTEVVVGLSKATITRDTIAEYAEKQDELMASLMSGDEDAMRMFEEDPDSVLENCVENIQSNAETQLAFFACNDTDTVELLEMLQRAAPWEPEIGIYEPEE
jgi:hypothetical protein